MTNPVLLVGNYPADGQESMLRFGRMLLEGLRERNRPVESIYPTPRFGGHGDQPAYSGMGKWLAYFDKFGLFPRALRGAVRKLPPGGVVHILDHSNAMYVPAAASAGHRVVVTCHDLGAVRGALGEATDCPASATGKILQQWIRTSLGRADVVPCDSSATREDVARLIRRPDGSPVDARKVFVGQNVAYSQLSYEEMEKRLSQLDGIRDHAPFILNVGSSLRRKNRDGVLRIFARVKDLWPSGKMVFAGAALPDELRELATQLGLAERIVEIVKPSDSVLEALYNRAVALLFPSRFEGFGWPVIEAQACGCPVLCSTAGSLAEVAGDSAFVRAAEQEEAFSDEILRLTTLGKESDAARVEWRAKGLSNTERFTTAAMLDEYERIYDEPGAMSP